MERGRVWIALRPCLDLIFNSAAGHCCLASKALLPHVTDVERLRSKACAFSHECTHLALAHVIADPSLQLGFQDMRLAAVFQSSLVGTTMYQQQDVMHQGMRAAAIGKPEKLLRHVWQPVAEGDSVETPAQAKEAEKVAKREMRTRLLELRVGMHLRIAWHEGPDRLATVAEQPCIGIERDTRNNDIGVRLRYADGHVMCERLACMTWRVVRVGGES